MADNTLEMDGLGLFCGYWFIKTIMWHMVNNVAHGE